MLSFVETRLFTRLAQEYLTDDNYAELQAMLCADPEAGVVIPGYPKNVADNIPTHLLRQIRKEIEGG